jgi:hypothetical protein
MLENEKCETALSDVAPLPPRVLHDDPIVVFLLTILSYPCNQCHPWLNLVVTFELGSFAGPGLPQADTNVLL